MTKHYIKNTMVHFSGALKYDLTGKHFIYLHVLCLSPYHSPHVVIMELFYQRTFAFVLI